jgi:hypothetical protein
MLTTWESFIDTMAGGAHDPTVEDVAGYMTDRHLAAWLNRELGMMTPEQLLTDIADELQRDLDGKCEEANRIGRIVLHALADRTPQTVVWRVLRDSMRRCAVRDACREIDAARSVSGAQEALRAWVERCDDPVADDRRALARDFNMVMRP